MTSLVTCPKCGKPESAYDDGYCGECEHRHQAEEAQFRRDMAAELRDELLNCPCTSEEGCTECQRKYAKMQEMQE